MSKRTTRTVHVFDEDGRPEVFGPGTVLPAWAAKQVTNEKVFEETEDEAAESTEPEVREGDPTDKWTHDELDARAVADGVEWSSTSLTKAEKVKELTGS